MTVNRKQTKEVRVLINDDLHAQLLALSKRRGESMADLIRPLLEQLVDEKSAEDGLDVVNAAIRKAVNSALKPFENRIAAMTAKSTIASATTMYTNHRLMQRTGLVDQEIISIHEESRKKAISYLKLNLPDK